jgi:hypothetical protein
MLLAPSRTRITPLLYTFHKGEGQVLFEKILIISRFAPFLPGFAFGKPFRVFLLPASRPSDRLKIKKASG